MKRECSAFKFHHCIRWCNTITLPWTAFCSSLIRLGMILPDLLESRLRRYHTAPILLPKSKLAISKGAGLQNMTVSSGKAWSCYRLCEEVAWYRVQCSSLHTLEHHRNLWQGPTQNCLQRHERITRVSSIRINPQWENVILLQHRRLAFLPRSQNLLTLKKCSLVSEPNSNYSLKCL